MKKWVCLLLILFLLPASALADSPVDPVLVPIAPETLPEGQYCHLGGSRILVKTGDCDPLLIYDLDTGETVIVTPREEDHELWVELGVNDYIAALATEGVICTDEEVERLRSYFVGDYLIYLFVMGSSIHVNSIGTEYVTLCESFLLNRHTGIITFIPEGLSANKFTSWDTFLSTNEEHTACLQYDLNGQLLHNYQIQNVLPLKNGAVAILGLTDKEEELTHYQCILLDKELNIRKVLDLGEHHNKWIEIDAAHLHEESGRLLLLTRGTCYGTKEKYKDNGKLRIREIPNGPYLDGLLLIDTETSEVHGLDVEIPEITTSFLASSDGSYVLLPAPSEEQLLKLDMKTGLITEQMSTSEVDNAFSPYLDMYEGYLGSNLGPLYYLSWDGGEYAVTPWMIFRVVERSGNP